MAPRKRPLPLRAARALQTRAQELLRNANALTRMRHVHGPRRVRIATDECIVVCMVKDGEAFLPRFIDHHLALGVRHIAFVDTGSSDRTLEIARGYGDVVSIYRSPLPVRDYETLIRRHLIYRMVHDSWCLVLDVDELFDYPHSDTLPLSGLLQYLNAHGYNAVVGQMLDLFPDVTLGELGTESDDFVSAHRFYDLADITKNGYHERERIAWYSTLQDNQADAHIKIHVGGIRRTLFGTQNCLTKHPLVRVNRGLIPVTHPHGSSHARCADFTVLLKHYKFAGRFHDTIRRLVAQGVWLHGENEAYMKAVEERPATRFRQPSAEEFTGVQRLVDEGFLVSSDRFDAWAARPR